MRQADEEVRDPKKERQAMLRFLAYLKPYLPMFGFATLCGITNYSLGAILPSVTGYVIDRILATPSGAPAHGHAAAHQPALPRAGPSAAPLRAPRDARFSRPISCWAA